MEICILDSKQTEKVKSFQSFVAHSGCGIETVVHHGTSCPEVSPKTAGILLFDDGDQVATQVMSTIRDSTRYLCIPLIAVAGKPGREVHARLLAAGASCVCDTDCSHENILSEIVTHCSVQTVRSELRDNLLGPFSAATVMTLTEMAGTKPAVKAIYQKAGYKMFGDVSAVIGLMARSEGSMVLSMPTQTAIAVGKRVLSGVADEPGDDAIRDCIGELANVIAGQARGILAPTPYSFSISTPTIISGNGHEIRHKAGVPCLVIAFSCDLGEFALQLCMA